MLASWVLIAIFSERCNSTSASRKERFMEIRLQATINLLRNKLESFQDTQTSAEWDEAQFPAESAQVSNHCASSVNWRGPQMSTDLNESAEERRSFPILGAAIWKEL